MIGLLRKLFCGNYITYTSLIMKKLIVLFLPLSLLSCKNNDNNIQFAALKQSLSNSNLFIISGNSRIYQEMQEKLKDPQTRSKAEIWEPKTAEVKKLSSEMKAFFDKLEADLKKDSANKNSVDQLFEKQGAATELLHRLTVYKKALIAIIKPEAFSDNPALHDALLSYGNKMKRTILLDSENDTIKTKNLVENSNQFANYFKNTTILGALTMLEKMKNDALTAENTMLQYFNSMTVSYSESYTKFSAIVTQSSSIIKTGETLKVYAGIGFFSVASKPTFTINGNQIPVSEDGMATYQLIINKRPGTYSIPVKVDFTRPDGTPHSIRTLVKYTVR